MKLTSILFIFSHYLYLISGEDITTEIDLSAELLKSTKPSEDPKKLALRYGFQQTHDCQNFDRAFLCVKKCLDLNFDVAYSDKKCKCTCYKNKDKGKYTRPSYKNRTDYMSGAPTTSKPMWATDKTKKPPPPLHHNDSCADDYIMSDTGGNANNTNGTDVHGGLDGNSTVDANGTTVEDGDTAGNGTEEETSAGGDTTAASEESSAAGEESSDAESSAQADESSAAPA